MTTQKNNSKNNISYTDAMDKINDIMDRLGSQEFDIDSLSKEIKEATRLISICKNKLRTAQNEIDKLFEKE